MNSFLVWHTPANIPVDTGCLHKLYCSHPTKVLEGISCRRHHFRWSSFFDRDNFIVPHQRIFCPQGSIRAEIKNEADGTWVRGWSPLSVVHSKGEMVAGKYKIIGVLGQGGVATTYEAETKDGSRVALKAMSLRNMKGWKDLDLFEREARVLKSLQHPGIPDYIDYFEVDSDTDRAFYIVQMVAEGRSLAEVVQNGWHATEEEIRRIAIEVLEILQYLGSLRPPVIHRDIKPENIILDEASGRIKLVDFGAVQDAAASVTWIGSTVVGTYGYMAPEQFQNRATVQSDLYGLGATILYLLSGRPPSSFPQKRLRIEFQDSVRMDPNLQRVVATLLEPAPEDRFQSAADAIDALRKDSIHSRESDGAAENQESPRTTVRQPKGTKLNLKRTASILTIQIPPVGLSADTVGSGTFALAWNSFLLFWTRSAVAGGAPLFFTLFSLPFWFVGFRLAKNTLSTLAVSVDMEFTSSKFFIQWSMGNVFQRQIEGQTKDIDSVKIIVEGVSSCVRDFFTKKYYEGEVWVNVPSELAY